MRLSTLVLALSACLLPLAASAQSKKPAEKIGRITPAHATSTCIGSAGSPVCATETLLACFARVDRSLCEKVQADPHTGAREPGLTEYVIDRITVIRAEDITDDQRDLEGFKAGNTLVELRRRACAAECSDEPWEDMQIFLRPNANLWEVAAWRGEVEENEVPEVPETFKPAVPAPQ
jgi:hypothetical protein